MFTSEHNLIITREALLKECKELDPWLPIDENTPVDGRDLLLHDGIDTVIGFWEIDAWYTESGHVHPTHYKLLPDVPPYLVEHPL